MLLTLHVSDVSSTSSVSSARLTPVYRVCYITSGASVYLSDAALLSFLHLLVLQHSGLFTNEELGHEKRN